MDGQVARPEMRCACRQKPPVLLSLISYLQTGAWQGRSSTLEANEAVWRRVGKRMIFRQHQKRSRHSLPPFSTDLETIDFIPALAPGEEEVSDFQGGARGGDAELRPEMQLRQIQPRAKSWESPYKDALNCLKDSKDIVRVQSAFLQLNEAWPCSADLLFHMCTI